MNPRLKEIENLMMNRGSLHITVYDASKPMNSRNHLDGKKNAENILQNYSSVEEYLKSFYYEKGLKEIFIELRRKNGSTFRPAEITEKIVFQNQQSVEPVATPQPTYTQPLQHQKKKDEISFLGAGVEKELPLDDYINLRQSQVELARVKEELKSLKSKNLEASAKNEQKLEKLKRKYKDYKRLYKEASAKKFIDSPMAEKLGSALETAVPFFLDKFSNTGGLAGGEQKDSLDGLSDARKQFFNDILKEEQVSDIVLNNLKLVAFLMATKTAFEEELIQLIEKHKKQE